MPTAISLSNVINLKKDEAYALPAREVLCNSAEVLEYSNSASGPWENNNAKSYPSLVVSDGAVAYWRLNETSGTVAKNIISGGLDGTIIGNPTLEVSGALSDGDTAMTFAASKRVEVIPGSHSTLGTGPATIECWAKIHAVVGASQYPRIFTLCIGGNTKGIEISAGTGDISFILHAASDYYLSSFQAEDNKWHHIVCVVRRNPDLMEIWIDGIKKNSQTITTGSDITATGYTGIGGAWIGFVWDASVDECAIYKVALTPDQILNHYNARTVKTPTYSDRVIGDGAVAYWRLNEVSGSIVKSMVGGVPDGTISGGVTLGVNGALGDGDYGMSFNPSGPADGNIGIPVSNYNAFGTGSGTIECWIRTTITPTGTQILAIAGQVTDSPGIGILISATTLNFRTRDTTPTVLDAVISPITSIIDGRWHHILGVLRRDSSDKVEIWLDGILKDTKTRAIAGQNMSATGPSWMGALNTTSEWSGELDEVAIYKTALTPQQITDHYNASKLNPRQNTSKGGFVKSSVDNMIICKPY